MRLIIWSAYEWIYGKLLNWQVIAIRRMHSDYCDKFIDPQKQRLLDAGFSIDAIMEVERNALIERNETGETQFRVMRRQVDELLVSLTSESLVRDSNRKGQGDAADRA